MELLEVLRERNPLLFWFGLLNLVAALCFLACSFLKPIEFAGVNAWYKPIKFALSTAILSWSLAWYIHYLTPSYGIRINVWIIIITLAFEVIYIAWQASRGQASHYNMSSPFYAVMYSLMALAATAATLSIAYIGFKFFTTSFEELPAYYVWAIRLGFVLFVIFSFEGFAMGSSLSHTVGGADGSTGIPFLNWSVSKGDLRVAHFIGMHALQVLPFLAWYLLKDVKLTIILSILYALLAVFVLVQALKGISITKLKTTQYETQYENN